MLTGRYGRPDLVRHKHFGAAAASSGGVELYHIVGVTPEADDARGGVRRRTGRSRRSRTAAAERRRTYDAAQRERAAIRTSTT